jgi:hypothetical protein
LIKSSSQKSYSIRDVRSKMKQVIVFISPVKFYTLLADDAVRLGFTRREHGNYVHLNGGDENVFYVQSGRSWAGEFDKANASHSAFTLVPDDFELKYEPEGEFVVLFHSGTPSEKVERLSKLPNFRGAIESFEEKDTIYDRLAQQIVSGSVELQPIWGALSRDYRVALIAELLTNIRLGGDLRLIELHDALSELLPEYVTFRNRIGNRFDGTDPVHKEALALLTSSLQRSLT